MILLSLGGIKSYALCLLETGDVLIVSERGREIERAHSRMRHGYTVIKSRLHWPGFIMGAICYYGIILTKRIIVWLHFSPEGEIIVDILLSKCN